MRRLIGLIALLVLIFGAVWLVQNGYDRTEIAGLTDFPPVLSADESVPPPDAAAEEPAGAAMSPASPGASDTGAEAELEVEAAEVRNEPEALAEVEAAAPEPAEPDSPAMTAEAPAEEPAAATESADASSAGTMAAGEPAMPPGVAEKMAAPPGVAEKMAALEPPTRDEPDASPPVGAVPTFDVVRVEPSGETVIAGLATPRATVEVLNHADPIAMAEANERGEWALVVDVPLPPGTHDLAIRTTSSDKSEVTLSDQRVAVSMPESGSEEPLVVLNMPDAASTVMQLPDEPEVAAATATGESGMAAAPEATPMAEKPATAGETETASAPEAAPMAGKPVAPGGTEMTSAPEAPPMAEEPAMAESPAMAGETEMASAPPAPEAAPMAERPATGGQPEMASAPPAGAATEAAGEAPSETVAVEEAPAPPPEPDPTVGVAAVEAETNGDLYIAGTATSPEPVRVYIDGELVGEATPTENGTWLVETARDLPPDQYNIRADQIDAGSGQVIARAEVPFEREIEVAVLEQSSESADPGSAEASHSLAGPMKVIIKRGDNLWRISREMYGHGVRYSTIYQANQDQIRDPDLIYPGQVFVLPAGNTAWEGQ